ncbi:Mce-associated membrane protein [Mycobacterium frederiksbergense]|uniref:Mce-associated membrane protein n=1 Tax=Mycolicibacterium frederiksbergense TaxID=117567 RepID=A0ABT6L8W5_9MYCO|nr:tetratricopeptide repeat protein [Mycolicibacterium frederiksbergense]MDH6199021.1 Mce-associated membrane protein [Mycolicibacterium frederiksbergense]
MTVTTDEQTDDEQDQTGDEAAAAEESATAEADAAIEAEPAQDSDGGTPRWRRRVLVGAVVAVFVAALALSGFLGWKVWQNHQVAQAGRQAQDAAVAYTQVLTSIDSNKVDENFDQVLAGATGEFKDMYSKSSMQLRQLLIDNKASAHGVVAESAVQSATKDKVVVLLFVDQSVSNTTVPDPRIDRSRIKMTMEKVDGQWRTSKVELA